MRLATKLMILGALALGIALPSTALASSSGAIHLYFDNTRSVSTDTGFTSWGNVAWGNNVSHSANVGKEMIACTFLTDSTARCSASIVIYKPGTTTADKSIFFKDELIDLNAPTYDIQGGTGAWAGVHSGVVLVHPVSDTADNVEADLVF